MRVGLRVRMLLQDKLTVLADAAKYDSSCASSGSRRKTPEGGIGNASTGICHSYTPDGRCVSLLKILLTNYCIYDCSYCVNRISSDSPRARFTIDEVVNLTMDFYKRNYIEGLFLSSGIIQTPDYTMEQLVGVARKLRVEQRFGGYIHLKGAPGASEELLREAGRHADRLSVNIEMPVQSDLDRLAPAKQHSVIETSMDQIRAGVQEFSADRRSGAPRFAPAGQTTQLIVGATASSDLQILAKSDELYKRHKLRRVYYSAFSPIPHASSELPVKPPPLVREHRLYQADWLVRFYGFNTGEITTADQPNLSLDMDPKLAWALRNRHFFPVDVNRAPKEALLRVPGFGVRNVQRILSLRRYKTVDADDLLKLRVPMQRAHNFIALTGSPARFLDSPKLVEQFTGRAEQLSLFNAPIQARSGEF
ncbi:MAG TPA: putative DNA modification/repair radical SAM protein, partial [Bryobacteraceae bacterium]|nr:putative DNA modification/repair radical SAM protein [Bryobacteraceae bacterium]